MATESRMRSTLKQTTLGELVWYKRSLICGDETTTVESALELMKRENILSLPIIKGSVVDMIKANEGHDAKSSTFNLLDKIKYAGMVNIYDIMSYVAFAVSPNEQVSNVELDLFAAEKFAKVPVADLVGISAESGSGDRGLWVYTAETCLNDVLEPLSKGVHRILVAFASKNKAESPMTYRILSQMDVVRFLTQQIDYLGTDMVEKAISALNLVQNDKSKIFSVTSSSTALHAFRTMFSKDVSAVAVVDSNGKMISNLSASDLRGMTHSDLADLNLPVLDFLSRRNSRTTRLPITAQPSDSLKAVMYKAVVSKVHRIWVVDNDSCPVGVVTLTDVLSKFSPFDYHV